MAYTYTVPVNITPNSAQVAFGSANWSSNNGAIGDWIQISQGSGNTSWNITVNTNSGAPRSTILTVAHPTDGTQTDTLLVQQQGDGTVQVSQSATPSNTPSNTPSESEPVQFIEPTLSISPQTDLLEEGNSSDEAIFTANVANGLASSYSWTSANPKFPIDGNDNEETVTVQYIGWQAGEAGTITCTAILIGTDGNSYTKNATALVESY